MRAFLSGMPECKIGLNNIQIITSNPDRQGNVDSTLPPEGMVGLEDVQFHPCVKLNSFDSDKTISFIPPDGEFLLMKYRTNDHVQLPFRVNVAVNDSSPSRVEYQVSVKSTFPSSMNAQKVVIRIPTPQNTASTTLNYTKGKAKYKGAENAILWKMAVFEGQQLASMNATAILVDTSSSSLGDSSISKKSWTRPPITLDFEVLMFTSSGLLIRYLKVFEKSNYETVRWVRYDACFDLDLDVYYILYYESLQNRKNKQKN